MAGGGRDGWEREVRDEMKGSFLLATQLWGWREGDEGPCHLPPLTGSCSSPYLQLQALGVAVFTFLRHTLALDCVRNHLVSVSLAEMFHIVSQIQVYQNVALLLLSIFSFLSCLNLGSIW